MTMSKVLISAGIAIAAGVVSLREASAVELPPPAYQLIGQSANVPSTVLFSLALQESGTRIKRQGRTLPWPWTLNIAGASLRFATRDAACTALLEGIRTAGAKRVDAGIGQLNLGWNGHRFKTPCDALDPYDNLTITAEILRGWYEETGDWTTAAGKYHRPAGGQPAQRYRAAFGKQLQRVLGNDRESSSTLVVSNP